MDVYANETDIGRSRFFFASNAEKLLVYAYFFYGEVAMSSLFAPVGPSLFVR